MICIELSCDRCSRIYGGGQTARELRAEAKEQGWLHQEGTSELPAHYGKKGDFCPECLALAAMGHNKARGYAGKL